MDEWLGALVEHHEDHRSEVVCTLGDCLDSRGNYDHTADALIIHRSALRYLSAASAR
ncbi:hypothetical protein [Agromyces sp. GXQ0307]|uniref:hypothetical protein n=1 Tax=Agromyces sp. GXQ0307 TaxID=3377835 RepID=UPI00383AA93B